MNQTVFSRDLEFLSSLANPFYLNSLAAQGVLSDPAFLRYLEHLRYFKHPRYARYLQYPHALHLLELLIEHPEFRAVCANAAWANDTAAKQVAHWATWYVISLLKLHSAFRTNILLYPQQERPRSRAEYAYAIVTTSILALATLVTLASHMHTVNCNLITKSLFLYSPDHAR